MISKKLNQCHFCTANINYIDYKDTDLLRRFTSLQAKIRGHDKTGVCTKHQRLLAKVIKQARFLGLLAYVPR